MKNAKAVLTLCVGLTLLASLIWGCASGSSPGAATDTQETEAPLDRSPTRPPLALTSSAFTAGSPIPLKYTCDGDDVSPPLNWDNVPQNTESLVLIVDDPDAPAGTWVHWVLFNVPPATRALAEAIPADAELADGSRHGMNGWKRRDFGGPCPPSGTHRYFFRLYALDSMLDLNAGASKQDVLAAMEGHILSQGELMGTYVRQ